MAVEVKKRKGKFRLVEIETGKLAKTQYGNPVDGGGHEEKAKAERQASYINGAKKRKPDGIAE